MPRKKYYTCLELAAEFDCNATTTNKWALMSSFPKAKSSRPNKTRKGKRIKLYDIEEVRKWRQSELERRKREREEKKTANIPSSREELTRIKIDRLKLAHLRDKGDLVEVERVGSFMEELIANARHVLGQIPGAVEAELPTGTTAELRAVVRNAVIAGIDNAMLELSRGEHWERNVLDG